MGSVGGVSLTLPSYVTPQKGQLFFSPNRLDELLPLTHAPAVEMLALLSSRLPQDPELEDRMYCRVLVRSLLGLFTAAALVGCAGSAPPAEGPRDANAGANRNGAGMSASAEIGGMNKAEVAEKGLETLDEAKRCVDEARKRLPYLGGDIAIFMRVNRQGRAVTAYLTKSTLGDQQTETCIIKAFRSKTWPRPVGGKLGELSQSYGFDAPADAPTLESWSSDKLARAMAADDDGSQAGYDELVSKLDGCRKDAGSERIELTWYLDEDGMAQAVGLSSSDDKGRAAADCASMVAKTTSFPSPGPDVRAKVTVVVP